jgi:large subunit ribosomal protein L23
MMVLIRPIITEKSLSLATQRQYTFEVDRRANVLQVSRAVAEQYKVTVEGVRTIAVRGDERRTRRGTGQTRTWKKAIITLKKGDKISGFELEIEDKNDKKHDHDHKDDKKKAAPKAEASTSETETK